MDGPQAKGVFEGFRDFVKNKVLDQLDFFSDWQNLDEAEGRHLDALGDIMGIPRPITVADWFFDISFRFWDPPPIVFAKAGFGDYPRSFSPAPMPWNHYQELEPLIQGGFLDFANPIDRPPGAVRDMLDEDYRFLLQTIRDAPGETSSLRFIDHLCAAYVERYKPYPGEYIIKPAKDDYPLARDEDIVIYLTEYNPYIYLGIVTVVNAYINPFPWVYVNMKPGG
jgi:hypothetical protein